MVDHLKQQKAEFEQNQKAKERVREENERIKQKEREIKQAEQERLRLETLERPKILNAKREKLIAERNTRRLLQAESSEKILSEKAAEIAHKNELRTAEVERYREIVQAKCESRSEEATAVERKQEELRRVFVYLDKNGDGLISAEDLQKRLTSLGCKVSLERAEVLMAEIQDTFGEMYGGCEGRSHWTWAMKMHQPGAQDLPLPEWSIEGQSKHSLDTSVVAERSWDNLGRADASHPNFRSHPSQSHLEKIQDWTVGNAHRIVCPDALDCCTRQDIQHPPVLTPRWILDASPQSSKQEHVSTVMLTESGLMTEKDWRAHLSLTPETKHLAWVGLRDCFFKYSVDMGEDSPLHLFTIVEFLMADKGGQGTASLEDCMSLMIKRFGMPSDSMFVTLFGNSCDPHEQIKLPVYLDKVRRLMAMKEITNPSRSRTATAATATATGAPRQRQKEPPQVMKIPHTPLY